MVDAVIVSTARTPIGKAVRGAFNLTHGADMGGHVIAQAVKRAGARCSAHELRFCPRRTGTKRRAPTSVHVWGAEALTAGAIHRFEGWDHQSLRDLRCSPPHIFISVRSFSRSRSPWQRASVRRPHSPPTRASRPI